jgi:hypothetical protein
MAMAFQTPWGVATAGRDERGGGEADGVGDGEELGAGPPPSLATMALLPHVTQDELSERPRGHGVHGVALAVREESIELLDDEACDAVMEQGEVAVVAT